MKKYLKKTAALIVTAAMLTSFAAGCTKDTESSAGSSSAAAGSSSAAQSSVAEPVTITWLSSDHGRVLKEGDPVLAEVEKKTGIKIEFQLITATDLTNKINLLVASQSLPDITKVDKAYDIFSYAPQGAFMEVNELVDKFGSNIKANRPQEIWDAIAVNGKYYGIPNTNTMGKNNYFIRQDWLNNLGLKMPTTTDELYEVFKQFVQNDPDKNGKNDTIAFGSEGSGANEPPFNAFMSVFGAFGIQPEHYYIKDNKAYPAAISSQYKDAITFIKKLFDDKLVDPDIFIAKADQAKQKLLSGKTGAFEAWWSIAPQVLMEQSKMAETVPGVEWGMIKDLKGPNGDYGIRAQNKVTSINCIAKNSKNAEAAVKLIDYLFTEEGSLLATVGLKDVHWTADANGKFDAYTDAGKKANEEKTLGLLSQEALMPDLANYVNKKSNPQFAAAIDNAANSKLYSDAFEGLSTTEWTTYNADLLKLETDWFIKFVTGKEPLTKWDEYVKQYNEKGGKAVFDSLIKKYNEIKGTNITAAN